MSHFAKMTVPPIRNLKYSNARVASFHDLTISSRTQIISISLCHHNWFLNKASLRYIHFFITTLLLRQKCLGVPNELSSCNLKKKCKKAFLRSSFLSCNFLFLKTKKALLGISFSRLLSP